MPEQSSASKSSLVIAALYHFARLPDYKEMRAPLLECCRDNGIFGSLLLAEEGINGTLAGQRQGIDNVLATLRADPRLADIVHKESATGEMPFHRLKVRLKKEIVTLGVPNTDPNNIKGTYLNAQEWNAMLDEPDVLVIDTRNAYEVEIGTFENATSPNTQTFRELPAYVEKELAGKKDQKIAMFCTGGIRCEKSTSYLKSLGYKHVFHLQGGILKYLETVEPQENRWQGECFVFDGRVSVDKDLKPGQYDQCHACRRPISQEDKSSPDYALGVSCPHCINEVSDARRARFAERQKQVELARQRGEKHIGEQQPGARLAQDDNPDDD